MEQKNVDQRFYTLLCVACCMSFVVLGFSWYGIASEENMIEDSISDLSVSIYFPRSMEEKKTSKEEVNSTSESFVDNRLEQARVGNAEALEEDVDSKREGTSYEWKAYQSEKMKGLIDSVSSGKEPADTELFAAFLDMELHGYQQYMNLSDEQRDVLRGQLEQRLEDISNGLSGEHIDSPVDFVKNMINRIHLAEDISYQSDMNSVAAYVDQKKVQCRSISMLLSLLWMRHAEQFPTAQWMLVHQPNHVEFALKLEEEVYSFEALDPNAEPQIYGEKDQKDSTVAYGKNELIDLLFFAAGKDSPYTKEALFLWTAKAQEKVEKSAHPFAVPIQRIGLSEPRENDDIVIKALSKPNNLDAALLFEKVLASEPTIAHMISPKIQFKRNRSRVEGTLMKLIPRRYDTRIRYCYDRARRKKPELEGSMRLQIQNKKNQKISVVVESGFPTALESCVISVLNRIASKKGALNIEEKEYTLHFSKP